VIQLLRGRGNDVLVILGPFNEHMIEPEQLPTFYAMRDRIQSSLAHAGVPTIVPDVLPSDLYADASHPLTAGYDLLARRIGQDSRFKNWVKSAPNAGG